MNVFHSTCHGPGLFVCGICGTKTVRLFGGEGRHVAQCEKCWSFPTDEAARAAARGGAA